MAATAGSL